MHTLIGKMTGSRISLLLSCLMVFLPLTVVSAQYATNSCGSQCTCGCAQGHPCTCKNGETKRVAPCGHECTCGCTQGHPCTCKNGETKRVAPCGHECTCGCTQGQPCTCAHQNQQTDPTNCCTWNHSRGIVRPIDVDINGRTVINEGVCSGGFWLPEDAPLFRPFMADPRQINFSAGWRFNDNAMTKNNIDVSYGDSVGIYRWLDVWPWHGQLQLDLDGCLWAVFNPCYESAPLMNADYYGGLSLTYAIESWQFRVRGFHISSHIGDEFLLDHPHFDRKNPSAEYLDFFISHDLSEEIRIYGGVGWIVAQDESFRFSPFYSALGAEMRLLSWGFLDSKDALYGCPIFGMYFRQSADFKRHVDSTYVLGYEIGKLCGLYRRWRCFLEYHDGYSVEGQFYKIPTDYLSARITYGF